MEKELLENLKITSFKVLPLSTPMISTILGSLIKVLNLDMGSKCGKTGLSIKENGGTTKL
jgi:hypothetical protein